jgi:hypothetical protein
MDIIHISLLIAFVLVILLLLFWLGISKIMKTTNNWKKMKEVRRKGKNLLKDRVSKVRELIKKHNNKMASSNRNENEAVLYKQFTNEDDDDLRLIDTEMVPGENCQIKIIDFDENHVSQVETNPNGN